MSFALAQKIADAVLYEGYLLYPYRASAVKNQVRWQFGIVTPRAYSEDGGTEPWAMQTECLIDPGDASILDCRIRFLQVQARIVERAVETQSGMFQPVEILESEGQQLVPWEQEATYRLPVRVWRGVMDRYFPDSAWLRLRRESFAALSRFKGRHALLTWDDTIEALLAAVKEGEQR